MTDKLQISAVSGWQLLQVKFCYTLVKKNTTCWWCSNLFLPRLYRLQLLQDASAEVLHITDTHCVELCVYKSIHRILKPLLFYITCTWTWTTGWVRLGKDWIHWKTLARYDSGLGKWNVIMILVFCRKVDGLHPILHRVQWWTVTE